MNLIVDIGNSSLKIAALVEQEVIELVRTSAWSDACTEDFFRRHKKFKRGIISTVRDESIPLWVNDFVEDDLVHYTHQTSAPIINGYESPTTLGLDRLAAAVGANNIYPQTNVLVVDCGTAITIDFVAASGVFEGGNISLGLNTRFKALNTFTSKLPLLATVDEFPMIGKNTSEAIWAGVLNGAIFELDSYIDFFKAKYPDIKVLITGGDAFFFERKLKNTIFVVPNLVILGLNRILDYNV